MKNEFKRIQMFSLFIFILYTIYHILYTSPVHAAGASFSLLPASGTYRIGDFFDVAVNLNTGGEQTSGADSILLYEPEKLEAQGITTGSVYSSYPIKSINSTAGKISISGIISDATSSFSGEGVFASIKFKALTSGTTTLRFDFEPGQPTDSNIAKKGTQGEDILNSVANATYTIGTNAGDGFPSPMPTPIPPPPVSGVFEVTLAVLLGGFVFFLSGFLLLVKPLVSRS